MSYDTRTTAYSSVLSALRNANLDNLRGLSVLTLSVMTGYPEPTVRRAIGELRTDLYNIIRDGRLVRLVS